MSVKAVAIAINNFRKVEVTSSLTPVHTSPRRGGNVAAMGKSECFWKLLLVDALVHIIDHLEKGAKADLSQPSILGGDSERL